MEKEGVGMTSYRPHEELIRGQATYEVTWGAERREQPGQRCHPSPRVRHKTWREVFMAHMPGTRRVELVRLRSQPRLLSKWIRRCLQEACSWRLGGSSALSCTRS